MTLCLACSERTICLTIKKSQKIMNTISAEFSFIFKSSLSTLIFRSSQILAGIYFMFFKNVLGNTWKSFNANFAPQWKDRGSSYRVRQVSAYFRKLVALILGQNCVKGLTVTNINKKQKFEAVSFELKERNCFQRQSLTKYLRQTAVFMWNSALQEKFNFYFSGVFC